MADLLLYFGVAFIPAAILSRYKEKMSKIKKTIIIILALALPVIIYALGYNVGTDRQRYLEYFNWCSSITAYMEWGFNALILACKFFHMDFKGFCAICSIIILGCVILSLKLLNLQKYYWIGLYISFFLMYFFSFNAMRQILSVAVFLLAYACFVSKKTRTALVLLVISCFFHKSGIIGLVILIYDYIVNRKRALPVEIRKNRLLGFMYSMILSLAFIVLIPVTLKIVHSMGWFMSYNTGFSISGALFLAYFLPKLVLIFMVAPKDDEQVNRYLNIWMLFIPLQMLGVVASYADRLAMYASVIEILLVARILQVYKPCRLSKKYFTVLIVLYYIAYFLVLFYFNDGNGIFPYRFY